MLKLQHQYVLMDAANLSINVTMANNLYCYEFKRDSRLWKLRVSWLTSMEVYMDIISYSLSNCIMAMSMYTYINSIQYTYVVTKVS